ncbi:GNAT family N-acetyltransferase [Apibacter muscae]|uniref:GNAT family N-acetyltransferase n=1 Tax=Apibacter muscae TaxID=2509004 RepID=UPI0011ABC74C|nr:GNAT family N-acetyltransferase [Apibacter muscae]TWP27891.1 GNAT family N-acetyltransferase [Apibacter muscae]
MSQIEIKKVTTKIDLKKFILYPNELYKDNPYYVPALISEEMEVFNEDKNPVFQFSICEKYLAYKNDVIVGRIAIIINRKEVEDLGIKKIRFGWFDAIDDISVTKALIDKAYELAQKNNFKRIEGPVGFTNLDKAGFLSKGYDKLATMIGIYNFPYYHKHFEKLGFSKANEWVEFYIEVVDHLPDKVIRFSKLLKEKYNLKALQFKSKKELIAYGDQIFKLLDDTYKVLPTYVPFSEKQIQYYKKKYLPFINKDYVICIADENNDLVGFAITMPSYSKALQKAKGKLFPLGWYYLFQASRSNEWVNFYLIGIHPSFQKKGITSIVLKEFYELFTSKGIKYLETNPELEDNKSIQLLWKDFNPINHKRRKTYFKEI